MTNHRFLNALAFAAITTASAAAVTVTPADMSPVPAPGASQWYVDNYRGVSTGNPAHTSTTVGEITSTQPRSGNGSVEMSSTDGSGKVDFAIDWGFGGGQTLGNLTSLSYDWYRDGSSTAASHFHPSIRLMYDADGNSATSNDRGYLIYERVYNGGGVTDDTWNSDNVIGANFWMFKTGSGVVEAFNFTLDEWEAGASSGFSDALSSNTAIYGMNFGIGSGWANTYLGFVDNVEIGFGGASTTYNFELAAQVPESANSALLLSGAFLLLAFSFAGRRAVASSRSTL